MGSTGRVTVSVSEDDPFWGLLADVHAGDERDCARTIVDVVARSWGQATPAAVRAELLDALDGWEGPASERLVELAADGPLEPVIIGRCWETLLANAARRSQGAHYTPPAVAAQVAELVLEAFSRSPQTEMQTGDAPTVWDPSCGGGAFLLATLVALETRTGTERSKLVEQCFATDIDEFALTLCDAALQIWSGGSARPNVFCGDALLTGFDEAALPWPDTMDLIVGNPPFLGQLFSDTSRSGDRAERLRDRYQRASRAYLDEAGLFVAMATDRVSDDGAIGLIIPASLLGAADAVGLRRMVADSHTLSALWIDSKQSFDAAVDVVAVVLTRDGLSGADEGTTTVWLDGEVTTVQAPTPETWAPLLAAADASPNVVLDGLGGGVVEDMASLTAGFRQHFYGIADAVAELADDGSRNTRAPALVTSGAIDPLHDRWGSRPIKFAKRRWDAPVLHLDRIEDPSVKEWFEARCRPKILLATQTPVIEAIVDTDGSMVPSVPVLVVEPADEDMLWPLAAALTSPAASAWLYQRAAGTGLSRKAIRLRAREVAGLGLPRKGEAWDTGAEHAKRAHQSSANGDMETYVRELRALGKAMDVAYGVDDTVGSWWWNRLDRRTVANSEAY